MEGSAVDVVLGAAELVNTVVAVIVTKALVVLLVSAAEVMGEIVADSDRPKTLQ